METEPSPPSATGACSSAAGYHAEDLTTKVDTLEVKDTIIDEPAADIDETAIMKAYEQLMAEDARDHLNIVLMGHIGVGRSTLAGQMLFATGGLDKQTIEKEASEEGHEDWYMAYVFKERRTKGTTVRVGRAHFETEKKRYTILDTSRYHYFVHNMTQGACQADTAILLVSGREGEFEVGFERGGQTQEYAQLAKTLGVRRLLVVVNKLDFPSVALPGGEWSQGRFDTIVNDITPILRQCGYNLKKAVQFLPVSAVYGHNIKEKVPPGVADWYTGPRMFDALDSIDPIDRNPLAPMRLPIVDQWRDMGAVLMGKIESGFLRVGDVMQIMPNKLRVKIDVIFVDEKEVVCSRSRENLRLCVTGAEESDVSRSCVMCGFQNPVPCVTQFEALVMIVQLMEHKPVFTVGCQCILHIHAAVQECEVTKLIAEIDKETKDQKKAKYIKAGGLCRVRFMVKKPICIETFSDVASLGRFTLRDEGQLIAVGKVTKLSKIH